MDGTVLVADDDRTIRTVLTQALTRAGCKVHATSSLTTLMRWIGEGKGDAVITDVVMPDGNGLEFLPKIAADRPNLPVIVISAQNTIMTAIKANEANAFDYLPKPFDLPDLMKRTARALDQTRPKPRAAERQGENAQNDLPLVGHAPVMQTLFRLVARVMNTDLSVLICGESGTGKSLIARTIHDFSDRRSRPFVTLTSADLQDVDAPMRILSRARGGTILFEELTDFPVGVQASMTSMMDTAGDNRPRFLATSQQDLVAAMKDGTLRDDLYYRLSGATVHVPALRNRVEDIASLAAHFLTLSETQGLGRATRLSAGAAKVFTNCAWPGNVRQLEHASRQLSLTSQGDEVSQAEAEAVLTAQPAAGPVQIEANTDGLGSTVAGHLQRYFDQHEGLLPPPGLYARILREIELPLIEIALNATQGNQAKCADLLGINRNTLRKKITELDIEVTRGRKLM